MRYGVEISEFAEKELLKLDSSQRRQIMAWIKKNLVDCEDPRRTGHPLTGEFQGLWRYRVGRYRIIAEIIDSRLVIVVVEVGHRKNIYDA